MLRELNKLDKIKSVCPCFDKISFNRSSTLLPQTCDVHLSIGNVSPFSIGVTLVRPPPLSSTVPDYKSVVLHLTLI